MPESLSTRRYDFDGTFAWSGEPRGANLAIRHFRLALEIAEPPQSLAIYVTADSRYRLFVNGAHVGRGPLKGTLSQYNVETYDIAPLLRSGRNALAAEVRWFGDNAPTNEEHSQQPGFMLHAPGMPELDTPGAWKVRADPSVTPDTTSYHDNAQQFLNHTERVDLRLRDGRDWRLAEYDDAEWARAVASGPRVNCVRQWGVADLRSLYLHDFPQLAERDARFVSEIRDGRRVENSFGPRPKPVRVPAGQGCVFTLDAGAQETAYLRLRARGGRGRELRITYAEAMGFWIQKDGARVWEKRRRDDISGDAHGYRDTLILSGREEAWEPFHWRTFWFVKIEILPGDEPCEILDIDYRAARYPLSLKAEYESSDPDTEALWRTSWRTMKLCAHETYADCPYYEQLNYIADTRLQAQMSYYVANEIRLAERCLRLYRDSARPDGLIEARVPSIARQIIPYFSFHWIFMLDDHWQWVGEPAKPFLRSCMRVVDGILVYFRDRLESDGFVGKLPPWNMVDLVDGWTRGEPPAVVEGRSTYITCAYIQALDKAIRLHREVGEPVDAERWAALPDRLRQAVRERAWDGERGAFLEAPGRPELALSEHAQVAAILAGAATPEQCARLADTLDHGGRMIESTLMQSYYLARALEQVGRYGAFHRRILDSWRAMLAQGTTTWWEYPVHPRSDCHAWSSWIATDFLSTVLGARAAEPGWRRIRIAPQTDGLEWARGAFETPVGKISIHWTKSGGELRLDAETPEGVPVEILLPGGEPRLHARGGRLRESSAIGRESAARPLA